MPIPNRFPCAPTILACALVALTAPTAQAQPVPAGDQTQETTAKTAKTLSFTDPQDGKFDASDYLLNHKGALPVPTLITEPAVGYGGGLGLVFFSESMKDAAEKAQSTGKGPAPPNITAVGGAYTANGTWGAGAAHFHTWDGDRYRYLGAIAKVDAQLDYYGLLNQARAYELEGLMLVQQFMVRLGDSHWYVGPRYVLFDSKATFKGQVATELGGFERDQRIGKGGLVVDYDSRDNIFYPSRGSYAELEAQFARGGFGSTQTFNMYNARGFTWLPLARTWILGLRADGRFSTGDIPFYAQPFVDLRGVSKGRYQDRNALATEMELRWKMTPRWSLLGFTGAGKAYGKWHSFSDAATVYSVGAGFRYLIARKLGLSIGIDVAHSKDQNAFYVQVGSAWH
ncbi:BamA/TamA family outer membrane protein [Cupriavidus basilensis]|uniref:BamA/TamA family outer membrane protein n=1 Tax=Cupriavidus basilensis TaxID=68895 RepID=UPI00265734E4|nr:BamA/TamA family outer membrane protein [Cupriavidus basilensis]